MCVSVCVSVCVVLGIELRALGLLSSTLTTEAMPPLRIFKNLPQLNI
jgi:hypothetical protein